MTASAPPTNRGRKFDAEPLTGDEVSRLLAAVPTRSVSGIRTRALIAVMFGAGLRVSEVLALAPRDVGQDGSLRVRQGKGGKTRTVGLDPVSEGILARWADRRAGLGLTGRHPLFATYAVGQVGGPMDPRYVRATLARFGTLAGIDKRVHPHGLRHSLAFGLAQDGVPVHVIQAQLGHSSLAVTSRYVSHIAPVAVVAAVRARNPYAPG